VGEKLLVHGNEQREKTMASSGGAVRGGRWEEPRHLSCGGFFGINRGDI
jgi:hypothetical protein